jgi:hypothetical protein
VVTSLLAVGQLYCYLDPDVAIQWKAGSVVALKVDSQDGNSNNPLQVPDQYGIFV